MLTICIKVSQESKGPSCNLAAALGTLLRYESRAFFVAWPPDATYANQAVAVSSAAGLEASQLYALVGSCAALCIENCLSLLLSSPRKSNSAGIHADVH